MIQLTVAFLFLWVACNEPINKIPACDEVNPCAEDACHPEECILDSTFVDLDTLWKIDMEAGNLKGMLMDDNSIYVNVLTSSSFYIAAYKRTSGELKWRYSNDLGSVRSFELYENKIIGQKWNTVFSIDANTGTEISNHTIDIGKPSTSYGYLLDQHYYTSIRNGKNSEAYLVRSNVNDLEEWETVHTVFQSELEGNEPTIESTNKWIDPMTKNEVLVFQYRTAFPELRIDLVAYNLTADSILWWHKEIDENGDSNIRQITISQGRAYFQGTSKLRCFDIASGDLVWETNYGPWNQGGKFFGLGGIVFTASEDILVVKYHEGLLALNAKTGEELWDKNDDDIHNTSSFSMTMYNDIVFFTHVGNGLTYNGPLWAIRASDGEEIWMKSTDFATTGSFSGPVLIDEERLVFYTRHEGNLIAFRMPEDMY